VPHFWRNTYAEITFLRHIRHFLLAFENNGTVKISEFFCVGLAIENKFMDRKIFGVWWSPIGVPLFVRVAYHKRHIYDISANNPCFLRANLMFYVGCSRPTKHAPTPEISKIAFFRSSLLRVKNPEFLMMGRN